MILKLEEYIVKNKDAIYAKTFQFVNPSCKCEIYNCPERYRCPDRIIIKPSREKVHKFVFAPQEGGLIDEKMKRKNEVKSNQKIRIMSPLTELWELGEYDREYTKKLIDYIDKYGFFWSISKEHEFYSYDLFLFINRLRKLHELFDILALHEKLKHDNSDLLKREIDYLHLFELTFFYIFSAHIRLKIGGIFDETCFYSYGDAWWYPYDADLKCYDINKSKLETSEKIFSVHRRQSDEYDEFLLKRHHQILTGLRERLNSGDVAGNRVRYTGGNLDIDDVVLYPSFPYQSEKIDDISEAIEFFHRVIPLEDKEGRLIADFLYTFIMRVSKIRMISADGTIKVESRNAFLDSRKFSEFMKEQLVSIAKMVYRKELNWGIQCIHPIRSEDFGYEWKILDYLSALYFAHFFTTSDDPELRRCAKPDCGFYFLVKRTNHKYKYCSDTCESAMTTRRSRGKD